MAMLARAPRRLSWDGRDSFCLVLGRNDGRLSDPPRWACGGSSPASSESEVEAEEEEEEEEEEGEEECIGSRAGTCTIPCNHVHVPCSCGCCWSERRRVCLVGCEG